MSEIHENPNDSVNQVAQDSTKLENSGDEKTFTQEKLDEIVKGRLREQKEKFEKQLENKVSQAIEDFKRKSQLSDEELKNEEFENQKKQLEAQQLAFEKEKTSFEMKNLLRDSGLNPEIAELINSNDSEKNKQIVEALRQNFEQTLKQKLDEQIAEISKGKTPIDPAKNSTDNAPTSGIVAL